MHFLLGEKFIGNENNVALILGDNFFYGQSLTKKLRECIKLNDGSNCNITPGEISIPSYGVASINKKNKITKIVEKPKNFFSNLAVTGLYFFDNKVVEL